MIMASNRRVRQRTKNKGVDIISSMHDDILDKILCFLPTKNAIATSVLSHRWNNLFRTKFSPIFLHLDHSFLSYENVKSSFSDFVDKILIKGNLMDLSRVETLFLESDEDGFDDHEKIICCVSAALQLKIRYLYISIPFDIDMIDVVPVSIDLLEKLNHCTTLVELQLGTSFDLCIPEEFNLPNLKMLVLDDLLLGDPIDEMIEGCPLLEVLCIRGCNMMYLTELSIESPLLKVLKILYPVEGENFDNVIIDAPNLENLVCCDIATKRFTISKFKSLVDAHIGTYTYPTDNDDDEEEFRWHDNCITKLVTACSNASSLYLSTISLKFVVHQSVQLPSFENLTWLSLGRLAGTKGGLFLARVLCNAHNLQKLTIDEGLKIYGGCYKKFRSSLPKIPVCLEQHFKEIEYRGFRENPAEMHLLRYFLEKGKVLEKVILRCLPFKCIAISERMRKLPNQSKVFLEPRDWMS